MEQLKSRDPREQKMLVMFGNAFRKRAAIDVRQNKAAEHEEEVDGEIALLHEMGVLTWIELREIDHDVVIEHYPQSCDPAK